MSACKVGHDVGLSICLPCLHLQHVPRQARLDERAEEVFTRPEVHQQTERNVGAARSVSFKTEVKIITPDGRASAAWRNRVLSEMEKAIAEMRRQAMSALAGLKEEL